MSLSEDEVFERAFKWRWYFRYPAAVAIAVAGGAAFYAMESRSTAGTIAAWGVALCCAICVAALARELFYALIAIGLGAAIWWSAENQLSIGGLTVVLVVVWASSVYKGWRREQALESEIHSLQYQINELRTQLHNH